MRLAQGAPDSRVQTQYKAVAAKCIERAEKIKAAKKDSVVVVRDPFSEGEASFDSVSSLSCLFIYLVVVRRTIIYLGQIISRELIEVSALANWQVVTIYSLP